MRPAVEALGAHARALSYSLCGEPYSDFVVDRGLGFDSYVVQLDAVLDRAGLSTAAICGVSFGGLIAVRYAALRPKRVSALVLASTPGPEWTADRRVEQYLRAPTLLSPLFVARSPGRLAPEILAAFGTTREAAAFSVRHTLRVLAAPLSPGRMAQRVRLWQNADVRASSRRVTAPTLLITGEPALDRVVPVSSTREYLRYIPASRHLTLERTGHIGLLTRPDRFAEIVRGFVESVSTARGLPHRQNADLVALRERLRRGIW